MSIVVGKSVHGVVLKQRTMIAPKTVVSVGVERQKAETKQAAHKVIAEHWKVLKALRDR
ncbi:MAG: hypothetical protein ACN6OK_01770 [Alcaligenes faecalis]